TRHGGYSVSPHSGLNVSVSNDDSSENVLRNRLLALESLGLDTYPCATAWMIHSADIATLDGDDWDDWKDDWPYRSYTIDERELIWTTRPRRKADAIITKRRGVALAMSSADCAPLLFYDPTQSVIALTHAGWRGTARGIGAATINAMREQFGCQPQHIYAGIGPTIGACCYEVTEEVRRLFLGEKQFELLPTEERYRNLVRDSAVFRVVELADRSSLHLDLWETNRNQLLLAGLLPEHIEVAGICTACQKEHFYSYRAEHGKTGRFPSILALRPE
ncbi:MAG TPA: peptidoglycan editing factor PgeF, partial [Ktedonobacteraceae bacterium]|nr:peptidoglycan editing factor PgeF [Ktedonobacteraceae bacterium]